MAFLHPQPYTLPEPAWRRGVNINDDPHVAAFNDLCATADELVPGNIIGAVLRWGVADGYAYYLVIDDDPVTVQHIAFADAWTVDDSLIRGLNRQDIEAMQSADARLRALRNA